MCVRRPTRSVWAAMKPSVVKGSQYRPPRITGSRLRDADVLRARDPVHPGVFGGSCDRHDVLDRRCLLPTRRVEPRVHVKDRCDDPHLHAHHTSDQRLPTVEIGPAPTLTDVQTLHADGRCRPAGSEASSRRGGPLVHILRPRFAGRSSRDRKRRRNLLRVLLREPARAG